MSRPLRIQFPGAVYHVMNRGATRQPAVQSNAGGNLGGKRGRENEARKVAMYLVKRCCDRTLPKMAEYFGTGSYSAVSWSCRAIEAEMAKERKVRDRIEKIAASILQLQT